MSLTLSPYVPLFPAPVSISFCLVLFAFRFSFYLVCCRTLQFIKHFIAPQGVLRVKCWTMWPDGWNFWRPTSRNCPEALATLVKEPTQSKRKPNAKPKHTHKRTHKHMESSEREERKRRRKSEQREWFGRTRSCLWNKRTLKVKSSWGVAYYFQWPLLWQSYLKCVLILWSNIPWNYLEYWLTIYSMLSSENTFEKKKHKNIYFVLYSNL